MSFIRTVGFAAALLLSTTPALAVPSAAAPPPAEAGPMTLDVRAEVRDAGTVEYLITVRNAYDKKVDVTVSQELPQGSADVSAGKAGKVDGGTVTWQKKLAATSSTQIGLTAVVPESAAAAFTAVCVTDTGSGRIYECAGTTVAADRAPWWQRVNWTLLAGIAFTTGLTWAGAVLVRRWWSQPTADPHRTGHTVVAAVSAVALLAVLGVGAVMYSASRADGPGGDPPGDDIGAGWHGPRRAMRLGETVSDDVLEFTAYRARCAEEKSSPTCTVVFRVRNVSGQPQPWRRHMQRLYVDRRQWTTPDQAATAKANAGRDIFAEPLDPNRPFIAVLVFPMPARAEPIRVELREGLFARGVYLPMRP